MIRWRCFYVVCFIHISKRNSIVIVFVIIILTHITMVTQKLMAFSIPIPLDHAQWSLNLTKPMIITHYKSMFYNIMSGKIFKEQHKSLSEHPEQPKYFVVLLAYVPSCCYHKQFTATCGLVYHILCYYAGQLNWSMFDHCEHLYIFQVKRLYLWKSIVFKEVLHHTPNSIDDCVNYHIFKHSMHHESIHGGYLNFHPL